MQVHIKEELGELRHHKLLRIYSGTNTYQHIKLKNNKMSLIS